MQTVILLTIGIGLLERSGFATAFDEISAADLAQVQSQLSSALQDASIPEDATKWIAILHKSTNILNCLPKHRDGNCFRSDVCSLPQMQVEGRQFSAWLTICKSPWVIYIDFELPKLPWWIKVKFDRVVIPIDHNRQDGITTIHSVSNAKAALLGIVNVAKASLTIDLLARWDCTLPQTDLARRASLNSQAPGQKFNAMFYKVKVRIEVKKKNWLFRYRCKKCEDVVDKQGTFGYGPQSCVDETAAHNRALIERQKELAQRNRERCAGKVGIFFRCNQP